MTLNFVDAFKFHFGEFALQEVGKLTGVEFGNNHSFVFAEYFGSISREWIDIAEMSECNRFKFLIERHDKKVEKAEDKEKEHIQGTLKKLEKDGLRTQLLLLILMKPEETSEILTLAQHYFVDLKGNWYMTSIFNKWLEEHEIAEPEWFNK